MMRKNRKQIILTMALAGLLLLAALFTPQPVQAAEIKVKNEQELKNAIGQVGSGGVIDVTANINLTDTLKIYHDRPFHLTSQNASAIKSQENISFDIRFGAQVTMAGNLKLETQGGKAAVYLDHARLNLTDQAAIQSKGTSFGVYGVAGASISINGGKIHAYSNKAQGPYGIGVIDSYLSVTGGSVFAEGTTEATGIYGERSSLAMSGGQVQAQANEAMGFWLKDNSTLLVGRGQVLALAQNGYGVGVQLEKSKLTLQGGQIRAASNNRSWGIKTEEGAQVIIQQVFSSTARIRGGTSDLTLVSNSLAEISSFSQLITKNGFHDREELILKKPPPPLFLITGKRKVLELEGAHAQLNFAIESGTSPELKAKSLGGHYYELNPSRAGSYYLVLSAKTDPLSVGKNTFKLRIPVTVTDLPFSDVGLHDWPLDYIMNLYNRKVIKGYPDGTFRPDNSIRRDHVAKMVAIGAGLNYQGKKADFPDVDPNSEMSPYIAALVEAGAIKGFPDGYFRPDRPIKRSHAAKIVAKAFKLEMGGLPVNLTDLPSDPELKDAIKILASNGIVKGYQGTDKFRPDKEISRAEFSKILSIAMAVSAIQEAETANKYVLIPGVEALDKAIGKAQALIDVLPVDQDLATRTYLQNRLDSLK